MKKLLAVLSLAVALCISLVSCTEEVVTPKNETSTVISNPNTPSGQFNAPPPGTEKTRK